MEENSSIPMVKTRKIIRTSIFTFLKNYQYFTSNIAFLVLPFSVSILVSQVVNPSSSPLLLIIQTRLRTLFQAAGFPPFVQFFSLLNNKLSQTIYSSIFTIPFTFSFLLITKASIIQALYYHKPSLPPSFPSLKSIYTPLFFTHLCNSFIILSANAAAFSLLSLAFNTFDIFGFSSLNFLLILSAAGAVLYSIILANTLIILNLALVIAGMENCGGFIAILKACVLIKGKASIAFLVTLPFNLGLAAIEGLFQYRVIRAYHFHGKLHINMAFEGMLIAYLYSLLILLDTIATCIFFKSCKSNSHADQEGKFYYQIELSEEDYINFINLKTLQELP